MEKQKKINLFKKLGATLISQGQWFLNKAFHVKYTRTLTRDQLKDFLAGLGLDRSRIYCADKKYYMIDKKTMEDIVVYDWTDKKKYLKDVFDCDDFANAFKSNLAVIYNVNSIGLAKYVKIQIGDRTVYHRCVLILVTDRDILKAFVFESQTDGWQELKKDEPIQIGTWKYELGAFDF